MAEFLPPVVLVNVLSFVDPRSLGAFSCVSKLWRSLCNSQDLWKRFCLSRHKICRIELFDNDWRKLYQHLSTSADYPVNRILVHALDGRYLTVKPDGTDMTPLTNEVARKYGQATWAPHSQHIIVAQALSSAHKTDILLYDVKGKVISTRYETPQHPFFFYWAPDSTRVTFLSNWPTHSVALHYIDTALSSPLTFIGSGRPYYYCFDPTGAPRILAHYAIGNLELIQINGSRKTVLHSGTLSSFTTPLWISRNEIIYVVRFQRPDDTDAIKVVCAQLVDPLSKGDLEKMPKSELEKLMSSCYLKINENEDIISQVMNKVVDKYQFCTESILLESEFHDVEIDFVGSPDAKFIVVSDGTLHVINIEEKKRNPEAKPIQIHDAVIAFFWSPNSRYLLFNTAPSSVTFPQLLTWKVYDTQTKQGYEVAKFSLSMEFRQQYLPFFCQYAVSLTFFSPDSRYFVYCDENKVNVCGVEPHSVPRQICTGTFATWSPC